MVKKKRGIDTRERIINLAEELFAKQGYDGTSTRQIASKASISIQTLHHHIQNKANLYNLVLERAMVPTTNLINEHVQEMLKRDLNNNSVLKDSIDGFIDDLFDMVHEKANYPLLFFRQWLEIDKNLKKFEWGELSPIIKEWTHQVEEKVAAKRRKGLDIPLLFLTFSWIYWALFVNPQFVSSVLEMDMNSPEYIDRLKNHAKDITVKLLGRGK